MIANDGNVENEEFLLEDDSFMEQTSNIQPDELSSNDIPPIEALGISNIAGLIEASIEKNQKFNCNDCSAIFESNEKVAASWFVKHKKNTIPCESTFKICAIGNKMISHYLNAVHESQFEYKIIFDQIKKQINLEDLYSRTNFDHDPDHKSFFVDLIIEELVRVRAVHRARVKTTF